VLNKMTSPRVKSKFNAGQSIF